MLLPYLPRWLLLLPFLSGCSSQEKVHDFVKDVEGKAYDSVATAMNKYCAGKTGLIAQQEALELRREIRQRVDCANAHGPIGPTHKITYLDDKTAYGCGPVMRIYCDGDLVPYEVWLDFIRLK